MKTLRIISRYLIGLTFIFSGFVKGQDPLGTSFRIEDYFIAYGMDWAIPASLFVKKPLMTLLIMVIMKISIIRHRKTVIIPINTTCKLDGSIMLLPPFFCIICQPVCKKITGKSAFTGSLDAT